MIELATNFIIKNEERASLTAVYKGIVLAIVMMFLITPLFQFGHKVSTSLTDAVISISSIDSDNNSNENKISNAIIRAMINEEKMESDKIEPFATNWKTIDINETTGGFVGFGDVYIYDLNFFGTIVISLLCVFLFFYIAIQMAKRVMELALYKIIGPFCCTSLTNNNSRAFQVWAKTTLGTLLITVVQFVCIGLLLNVYDDAFSSTGLLAGIFLVIGSLLFIISTPTIVSSLLDQQSGVMSGFGDIQSLMALSVGSGQISKGIGAFGLNTAKFGGNIINNGINKFKNNSNSNLNDKQKTSVQDSMKNHNSYEVGNKIKNYTKENMKKGKSNKNDNNIFKFSNTNPFQNPHSMKFNPIRNQYMNQNNKNNNGRWY